MEKYQSEHYQQLPFKKFLKIILNSEVIIESILDQDDNFWRSSLVLIG